LWFASWKNGQSSYAPQWVKRDYKRFPRARTHDGGALELLSPFSKQNVDADARAFSALMAHLAAFDKNRTCIMAQVENEIGLMPDSRDYSGDAEMAWSSTAPNGANGQGKSWLDAYGDLADSAFMAYGYSQYVEDIAAAGKRAYPIPLYVNASLPTPGAVAGKDSPSGGPLPEVAQIWRENAPSIDFIAPDIYSANFTEWAARYRRINPLFIPEANWAGSKDAPANALLAFGSYGAIGFSPFAIDKIDRSSSKEIGVLYGMLETIAPLVLERQGTDEIAGFRPTISFEGKSDLSPQKVVMGDHVITAHFIDPWTPQVEHEPEYRGGLVMMLNPDTFLLAGRGVTFTFAPARGEGSDGIQSVDEGTYQNDKWTPSRRLNGDDTYAGRHVRLPFDDFGVQKVVLYHYQ
jgi:beta-galactosidase GanA